MILFPAIDIKEGQAVRLRQGKAEEKTVFSADPLAVARHWVEQGAVWLHVVDLDGAFEGRPVNLDLIASICALSVSVQVGGGIRTEETARRYLQIGVSRLILGTVALEKPDLFSRLCDLFPGRIGVSLDARGGRLMIRGWVSDAGLRVEDILPRLADQGSAFVIYTDIERDGMQNGLNPDTLGRISAASPLPVIAAGGVTTLADIRALHALHLRSNLAGAVTGRALYEGTLDLREALSWIAAQPQTGTRALP